jgi:nitrogen fixation/metabolism regulation signal transduction histidine kinase
MKIGIRLALTFGSVLVWLLVICTTASVQMSRMSKNIRTIVNDRVTTQQLGSQLKEGASTLALSVYRALDERTPETQQADLAQLQAQREEVTSISNSLENRLVPDAGPAAFKHLEQVQAAYLEATKAVLVGLAAHDRDGVRGALLSMVPIQNAFFRALDDLLNTHESLMDTALQESLDAYGTAREVLWGLAALALISALSLCAIMTRSIVRPLGGEPREAAVLAREIAAGNLRIAVRLKSGDHSSLMFSLCSMKDQLATYRRASSNSLSLP